MEIARRHKRKISFADLEATFRRAGPIQHAPPPPPQQPQMTPQQAEAARQETVRRAQIAKQQSKKPTDREIPEELADVIVGDGVQRYKKLRDVERRLDATMMRKRLDIQDQLHRQYERREGVLRVWISNTAEGQPWQYNEEGSVGFAEDGTFDFGDNSQATFRVKIEGRLLPDPAFENDASEEDKKEDNKRRPRLSHFFKSITIRFDTHLPDGYSAIEWQKPTPQSPNYDPNGSEASFDTLEFERKGDENMNVSIELVRDVKSERYKLSPPLAELLDTDEEDLPGAVHGVWEYCRAMGLQEDDEKRHMIPDEPLRRLFPDFQERIYFPQIPDMLRPHLQLLDPIKLAYTIRVDKNYITGSPDATPPVAASIPTVYDVRVPLPNPVIAQFQRLQHNKSHLNQLQTILQTDDDLALLVQKIHNTNAKRKFLENLAKDPKGFVKRWFESQMRDQEVILAEGRAEEGLVGGVRKEVWGTRMAEESVALWLARGGKAH